MSSGTTTSRKENQFDFSGEKDFEGYLQTAQDLGLFVTARVGPLRLRRVGFGRIPGVGQVQAGRGRAQEQPRLHRLAGPLAGGNPAARRRTPDPPRAATSSCCNSKTRAHGRGAWEGKAPDPYYQDLYDNAKKHGIEIPFFMSGYNHGTSPCAGEARQRGPHLPLDLHRNLDRLVFELRRQRLRRT